MQVEKYQLKNIIFVLKTDPMGSLTVGKSRTDSVNAGSQSSGVMPSWAQDPGCSYDLHLTTPHCT